MALVFTDRKFSTMFNIKDETTKDNQHDITYGVVCPDANHDEEHNGKTGR